MCVSGAYFECVFLGEGGGDGVLGVYFKCVFSVCIWSVLSVLLWEGGECVLGACACMCFGCFKCILGVVFELFFLYVMCFGLCSLVLCVFGCLWMSVCAFGCFAFCVRCSALVVQFPVLKFGYSSRPSLVLVCASHIIAGIIAATGTTPHAATTGCSHPWQAISQAL